VEKLLPVQGGNWDDVWLRLWLDVVFESNFVEDCHGKTKRQPEEETWEASQSLMLLLL
jgi:hypothetical protein